MIFENYFYQVKNKVFIFIVPLLLAFVSCGVYSLSGASIEGKNINIHIFENRARNIVPTLPAALTEKIRSRIVSQTGLASVNIDNADYDISGVISSYEVSVTSVQNTQQATQNRLTISINVSFKNRLNEKGSFEQTFTRFADYPASQTLQTIEQNLISQIATQLADDIFNKAFVNW